MNSGLLASRDISACSKGQPSTITYVATESMMKRARMSSGATTAMLGPAGSEVQRGIVIGGVPVRSFAMIFGCGIKQPTGCASG